MKRLFERLYRFYESLSLLAAFWRRRQISLSCSAFGSVPGKLLELVMINTFWHLDLFFDRHERRRFLPLIHQTGENT